MTASTITYAPCLPADTDSATAVLVKNWHYDATFPFQYPECGSNPSTVSDFTHANLLQRFEDPIKNSQANSPQNMEAIKATVDGKFAGFAIWEFPGSSGGGKGGEKKKIPVPRGSERFREECGYAAGRQFAEKMKVLYPEYMEVQNVNLHAAYQRHGIGTEFMKMCFEKADELGLPIMVMSVPYSRDFYVKVGFEEFDHFDFQLERWAGGRKDVGYGVFRCYALLRKPAVEKN